MLGLLQRATSNLKNPVTATAWAPSDELAAGFHRFSQVHSLLLSSLATFAFAATGYYAKGTILFLRRGQGDGTESTQYPPAYDDDNLKPRVEGEVHVAVEARTNSEGLYADSRLEPVQGHERCGISLTVRSRRSCARATGQILMSLGTRTDTGIFFGREDRRFPVVPHHGHVPGRV